MARTVAMREEFQSKPIHPAAAGVVCTSAFTFLARSELGEEIADYEIGNLDSKMSIIKSNIIIIPREKERISIWIETGGDVR